MIGTEQVEITFLNGEKVAVMIARGGFEQFTTPQGIELKIKYLDATPNNAVVVQASNPASGKVYSKQFQIQRNHQGVTSIQIPIGTPQTKFTDGSNDLSIIDKMNQRMYFLEELTDLWIGGHIDKDRYAKFRKLFKTNEREFAVKMVKELHIHHINN